MHLCLVHLPLDSGVLTDKLYEKALGYVDEVNRVKAKKFYHRADAWRCLIAQIQLRVILHNIGVEPEQILFKITGEGKPFLDMLVEPPFVFNISHDNSYVAVVHDRAVDSRVGVDVMKMALPRGQSFGNFVQVLGEQLTSSETRALLSPTIPPDEAVRRLYLLWTLKESYTKALGVGLGFDFRRIEYDFSSNQVCVDKVPLRNWQLCVFEFGDIGGRYIGAISKWSGEGGEGIVEWKSCQEGDWCVAVSAEDLLLNL